MQRRAFTLDLSIISRILLPTSCFHNRFVDYFSNSATSGVLSLQICRLFLEFCYQRRAFTFDLSIISRIFLPTACFHFRFVDYFSNFSTNDVLSLQICRLFLAFYNKRRASFQTRRLFLEFCYQRRAFTLDLQIISRILLPTACFHFRFTDYFSNFATTGVLSLQIFRLFLEFCYQRPAFTLDLPIISRILLPPACFHYRFFDYFSNFAANDLLSLQICRLFLQFCSQRRVSLQISRLSLEFCYQRRAFTSDLSIISPILLPTACFHFRFVDYFSNFATKVVLSLQICRLFLEFCYQRRAFTLDLPIIA